MFILAGGVLDLLVDFLNKLVIGDYVIDFSLDLLVGDIGRLLLEQRHQPVGDLLILRCALVDLGHELRLGVLLDDVGQVVELVHCC